MDFIVGHYTNTMSAILKHQSFLRQSTLKLLLLLAQEPFSLNPETLSSL
jgi:hypothetical protein